MLTIVYVSPSGPEEGGPHLMMAGLWLASRGHPVLCVLPSDPTRSVLETPLGRVLVRGFRSGGPVGLWRLFLLLLGRRLAAGRNTVFYVEGNPVTPAACLALIGMPAHRVVYHTQDFPEPHRAFFRTFFERWMARRAGWVISNEPTRARLLADHFGLRETPTVVRTSLPRDWPIPERDPAVRREILSRLGRTGDDCRLVAAGGTFSNSRCSAQVVRAFQQLPPRYVLVFSGVRHGSPAWKQGMEAVGAAGLEDRTVMDDLLPYQEWLRRLAACDIGILLYPHDGMGNFHQAPGRLTEYMTCGLPFVASNFPGLEQVTQTHRLGLSCDPQAPDQIARAILQLGERPDGERAAERSRLRQLARTEFAYETQAGRIEDILKQIEERCPA